MQSNEIATKNDIAALKNMIERLNLKLDQKIIVKKRAYSRREACTILNISEKKLLKLEEHGKLTGSDYLPNDSCGKLLYKASSVDKLIDDMPN